MALYNNGFPAGYPQFPYPYPAQQNNGIIWVQGKAGADAYMVARNTKNLPLWDSEAQVIYLKSADDTGRPSMQILDYTIRDAAPAAPEYATKADIDALRQEIEALRKEEE